jgi:hypothetical protein
VARSPKRNQNQTISYDDFPWDGVEASRNDQPLQIGGWWTVAGAAYNDVAPTALGDGALFQSLGIERGWFPLGLHPRLLCCGPLALQIMLGALWQTPVGGQPAYNDVAPTALRDGDAQ